MQLGYASLTFAKNKNRKYVAQSQVGAAKNKTVERWSGRGGSAGCKPSGWDS